MLVRGGVVVFLAVAAIVGAGATGGLPGVPASAQLAIGASDTEAATAPQGETAWYEEHYAVTPTEAQPK